MHALPEFEPEETGRLKRKQAQRNIALNGCLCSMVADDSVSDGVVKCKQAGCETQWVFDYWLY